MSEKPSHLLWLLSLSTEQRLQQLSKQSKVLNKFECTPHQIVFQNIDPFKNYEAYLRFRNTDSQPRRIELKPIQDMRFEVILWRSNERTLKSPKIAPGMDTTYLIRFTPDSKMDLETNVVCITENEQFLIPLHVKGPRAVFDFPDKIEFGEVMVRYKNTKTILVRNIGTRTGTFSIETIQKKTQDPETAIPFKFTPSSGLLESGSSIQVVVEFFAFQEGLHSNQFEIKCEPEVGTCFFTVEGEACNSLVKLSLSEIEISDTWITHLQQHVIHVINKTDFTVDFKWKKFPSSFHDSLFKAALCKKVQKKQKRRRQEDILDNEHDLILLQYAEEAKQRQIMSNALSYLDPIFSIEPLEGKVWPNETVAIQILFKPLLALKYQTAAFLEVSGRESRLPLLISGLGLGPKIKFEEQKRDLGMVYVGAKIKFFAKIKNTGPIDANLTPEQTKTIKCSKNCVLVQQMSEETVEIEFQTLTLGLFDEVIWFKGDSNCSLQLLGNCIGPVFEFNVQELDLKKQSLGFEHNEFVVLSNRSEMDFEVQLSADPGPHELNLTPNSFKIPKLSSIVIKVSFLGKLLGEFGTKIKVESLGESKFLPLRAEVLVPEVCLSSHYLDFGSCFIGLSCHKQVDLLNLSPIMAGVEVCGLESEFKTKSDLKLEPNSSQEIEFTFTPTSMENIQQEFIIYGGTLPQRIYVSGSGKLATVETIRKINFHKIPVLETHKKQFKLLNSSPISANVDISVDEPFFCSLKSCFIEPYKSFTCEITAYLRDNIRVNNIMSISKAQNKIEIQVQAMGLGTTIINLPDFVSFDQIFTNTNYKKEFEICNMGKRTQKLYFSPNQPCFQVNPPRLTLKPMAKHKIEFIALSKTKQESKHEFVCQSSIGQEVVRHVIANIKLNAEFCDPIVLLEPNILKIEQNQQKCFYLTNKSNHEISLKLNNLLFYYASEYEFTLQRDEKKQIMLNLKSEQLNDKTSRQLSEKLKIQLLHHPMTLNLDLKSNLLFPNLELNQSKVQMKAIQQGMQSISYIKLRNPGIVAANFKFRLETDEIVDIIPFFGTLEPKQETNIQITFHGTKDGIFDVFAYCAAENGPEYKLQIHTIVCETVFEISPMELSLSCSSHMEQVESHILILNKSSKTQNFKILQNSSPSLNCFPSSGEIESKSTQKIQILCCPFSPGLQNLSFEVMVDYMEPVLIKVNLQSSTLLLNAKLPFQDLGYPKPSKKDVTELCSKPIKRYFLDFGYVKKGEKIQKTITFEPNKPGSFSSNMQLGQFEVCVKKYHKFQQNFDLQVNLDTTKLGKVMSLFSMQVIGGSVEEILLEAFVQKPEIQISHSELMLGQTFCGKRLRKKISLRNSRQVSCDYMFLIKSKCFSVSEPQGIVLPDSEITLWCYFEPMQDGFAKVDAVLFANQEQCAILKLSAVGKATILLMEPEELRFNQIAPFTDGLELKAKITNKNDFSIDLFSFDFDSQFKNDAFQAQQMPDEPDKFFTNQPMFRDPPVTVVVEKPMSIVIVYGPPLSKCSNFARRIGEVQNIDVLFENYLRQNSIAEQEEFDENHAFNCFKLFDKNLLVLDSLDSKYLKQLTILKGLFLNEKKPTFYFVHLKSDAQTILAREREKLKQEFERELSCLPEIIMIEEQEYTKLSLTEQNEIDERISKSKLQRKLFFMRKEEEKRHYEMELALRRGEKRPEDDKKRKDKRRKAVTPAQPLTRQLSSLENQHQRSLTHLNEVKEIEELRPEMQLSDAIFRKYEAYTQQVDAVVGFIKEQEKHKQQDKKKKPQEDLETLDEVKVFFYELDSNADDVEIYSLIHQAVTEPLVIVEEIQVQQVFSLKYWRKNYFEIKIPFSIQMDMEMEQPKEHSRKQKKIIEDIKEDDKKQFRWLFQPMETKTMIVRFQSNEVGDFQVPLRFGITGTPHVFQMFCFGSCHFPSLSKLKLRKLDFGPLPINRSRTDKEKFPENKIQMQLSNPNNHELKLMFALVFEKSDVFVMEHTAIDLKASSQIMFTISSWPKSCGKMEDVLIICIKDNPDPLTFKISCIGYKPEIELDRKNIDFDKLIITKQETQKIKVRNPTCVSLQIRLIGVDSMGEELQVHPIDFILNPSQENFINFVFKALKTMTFKKTIKLEYHDKMAQFVGTESITIVGEAYDFAVDLSLPKQLNYIDFGALRLNEEMKVPFFAKNKGKYEILYKVQVEEEGFTVLPMNGVIMPSEKPQQLHMVCVCKNPTQIQEKTVCKCLFLDSITNLVFCTVNLKASVRADYSKYQITPRELVFGSITSNQKEQKSFCIENLGEFEFKVAFVEFNDKKRLKPPSPTPVQKKRDYKAESANFGAFCIVPLNCSIPPQSKQNFNVEFMAEVPGNYHEVFCIDVSEQPELIKYHLMGDSCVPKIDLRLNLVFEDIIVCKRLLKNIDNHYAEEEKTLYFGALCLGSESQKQLKLTNNGKVNAEVQCQVKTKRKEELGFSVEPNVVLIPQHEHRFVQIKFHPSMLQTYSAYFEATINQEPVLCFDLKGESTLPKISCKSSLKFKKTAKNQSDYQKLKIQNDGLLKCTIQLEIQNPNFFVSTQKMEILQNHSLELNIEFKPQTLGLIQSELKIRVLENNYDQTIVSCSGECVEEELLFDLDELMFMDCFVGEKKMLIFKAINNGKSWIKAKMEGICEFQPQQFTLRPGMEKQIQAFFLSMEPANVKTQIKCIYQQNQKSEFDSQEQTKTIPMSAVCDYSIFSCTQKNIQFKQTMMYQTRTFSLTLMNPGQIRLEFETKYKSDYAFCVLPAKGMIPPLSQMQIQVKFSPKEECCFEDDLEISFNNQKEVLHIPMSGQSIRPICHFELQEDVIDKVLDPQTHAIVFKSCGINSIHQKKFFILNCSLESWNFEITSQTESVFCCKTKNGFLKPGKRFEIVFEYLPLETIDLEQNWVFHIPKFDLKTNFLLLGSAFEPNLFFNKNKIVFKPCLVDKKVEQKLLLCNMENQQFQFFINYQDLGTPEKQPLIIFNPQKGVLEPNSEQEILLSFCPKQEKEYKMLVSCLIPTKTQQLKVNIQGFGMRVDAHVEAEHNGHKMKLQSTDLGPIKKRSVLPNLLEFGRTFLGDQITKKLIVCNMGKIQINFTMESMHKCCKLTPTQGIIRKGGIMEVILQIQSFVECTINDVIAICKIQDGKEFLISASARITVPRIHCSPSPLCFNGVFLNSPPLKKTINLTNQDQVAVLLEIKSNDVFKCLKSSVFLAAEETASIEISFEPKEIASYNSDLLIQINGHDAMNVRMFGEACLFDVRADSNLDLGILGIKDKASLKCKIQNYASTPAIFELCCEELDKKMIKVFPKHFELQPNQKARVQVEFTAKQRVQPFEHAVKVLVFNQLRPLFMVKGGVLGTVVMLESDVCNFGNVCLGSFIIKKLAIQNKGDLGARFQFKKMSLQPEFTISPLEGYLAPNMHIMLEISFNPHHIKSEIKSERVPCEVEGQKPLHLSLFGSCVHQNQAMETLKFSAPVRSQESKTILISNKTQSNWIINPSFDSIYFRGDSCIQVDANSSIQYEIFFKPLRNQEYSGQVYFPTPDGNGLLYLLHGVAEKPTTCGEITRDLESKKIYTQSFKVRNWTNSATRFKVTVEPKPDVSCIFHLQEYIHVPAGGQRTYKLSMQFFKEANFTFKVLFTCDLTQEYMFYNLLCKVGPASVQKVFLCKTLVRQMISNQFEIENPISVPVLFNVSCLNQEVSCTPLQFTIPSLDKQIIKIDYMPLLPREASTEKLILSSLELGSFVYELELEALQANPEKTVHLKTTLGSQTSRIVRITHYCKTKTDFLLKLDHCDFLVEKTCTAIPQSEIQVEVVYEPSKIGVSNAILYLSSPQGEYTVPLHGTCIDPQPCGPIVIKTGQQATISFKNVFTQAALFTFVVDNNMFSVKSSENIASRRTAAINVGFKCPESNKDKKCRLGKLSISHGTHCWTYLLKGIQ